MMLRQIFCNVRITQQPLDVSEAESQVERLSTQQATRRSPARSGLTALNSVQLRRLLDFSARHPSMRDLHDVALIVVKTGIEPSELTHVRWAHVDPRARTIFIVGEERAKRWCWSGSRMRSVLKERQQREPDAEFVLGKAPDEVLRRTMRQFRKVCQLFGWGNVRFDVLRRTWAIHLLSVGFSMRSVQGFLGHRSRRTTQKFLRLSRPALGGDGSTVGVLR